jgi:hypothetical protein
MFAKRPVVVKVTRPPRSILPPDGDIPDYPYPFGYQPEPGDMPGGTTIGYPLPPPNPGSEGSESADKGGYVPHPYDRQFSVIHPDTGEVVDCSCRVTKDPDTDELVDEWYGPDEHVEGFNPDVFESEPARYASPYAEASHYMLFEVGLFDLKDKDMLYDSWAKNPREVAQYLIDKYTERDTEGRGVARAGGTGIRFDNETYARLQAIARGELDVAMRVAERDGRQYSRAGELVGKSRSLTLTQHDKEMLESMYQTLADLGESETHNTFESEDLEDDLDDGSSLSMESGQVFGQGYQ